MRPRDRQQAQTIDGALTLHHVAVRALPGIGPATLRAVFIDQVFDSIHRVEYARRLVGMTLGANRSDPNVAEFDPLKAAVLQHRQGNVEEACWLVFLFVHFGRDRSGGWGYVRSVFGRLGTGQPWDWASVSANLATFRAWLAANMDALKSRGAGFGNHRKYMSLDAYAPAGTGAAVDTYVGWVLDGKGHAALLADALDSVGGDPKAAFDVLYRSMQRVAGFGRTARFDYLTMLGKLGIAGIEPGRAYLTGATGPVKGANLLFGGTNKPSTLDDWLVELDASLGIGMQVLEDALCNWQKSPGRYVAFRG